MALWLGLMRLAERAGIVQRMAHGLRPLMRRLFPEVPSNHPTMGSMLMNMAANMLGLGNAATPLGLRAMRDLKALNPRPGVATNAMCTFLAINTSSVQLVPTTAIAILAAAGSSRPTAIVGTALFATLVPQPWRSLPRGLSRRCRSFSPGANRLKVGTDRRVSARRSFQLEEVCRLRTCPAQAHTGAVRPWLHRQARPNHRQIT